MRKRLNGSRCKEAAVADIKFLRLWDIYSALLTPTQREITDMYFNLDLTVSEIAEQKGISRQGVSECLSSARRQLEEYEEKLHFSKNLSEGDLRLSPVLSGAERWADKFLEEHPQYADDISRLKEILRGEGSAEAVGLREKTYKEQ